MRAKNKVALAVKISICFRAKIRKKCIPLLTQVLLYEPLCEKTYLQGFRPGPHKPGFLAKEDSKRLEISDLGRKKRDCSIFVAQTKAWVSCAFTAHGLAAHLLGS